MVQITIRNVPQELRDQLAVRAALQRQSMQEYLLGELQRIASRPSPEALLERVRQRKEESRIHVPIVDILQARDADRK